MSRKISIVVACGLDRAIGKDNKLLWNIPQDMRLFRHNTIGKTVIMGRNTALSIGRPLPGRWNIVLSRTLEQPPYEQQVLARSLNEALEMAPRDTEICIIGGASLYRDALSLADKLYLSVVHDVCPDADAHFPPYDLKGWRTLAYREYPEKDDAPAFSYGEYVRAH